MTRISPTATRSDHDRVCRITRDLIAEKAADSRRNNRRREIHAFHENDEETLQRMLNALQPSSYIRPHRHDPRRAESLLLLQGTLGFVTFDDPGELHDSDFVLLSPQTCAGVDCRGGVWHTFFALEPDTVIFEIKPGPFDARTDKEFAPWAPPENTAEGLRYLAGFEDRFRSHFQLASREWRIG